MQLSIQVCLVGFFEETWYCILCCSIFHRPSNVYDSLFSRLLREKVTSLWGSTSKIDGRFRHRCSTVGGHLEFCPLWRSIPAVRKNTPKVCGYALQMCHPDDFVNPVSPHVRKGTTQCTMRSAFLLHVLQVIRTSHLRMSANLALLATSVL